MFPFFNTYKNEIGQKKLLKSREEGMAHVHVGSIGWINRLYFILDRQIILFWIKYIYSHECTWQQQMEWYIKDNLTNTE